MVRHKTQDPYDLAVDLLEGTALVEPLIVFVGPACRTWYVDIAQLRTIMADLFEVRRYTAVHGGKFPFDVYVERHAQSLGIPHIMVGPASRDIRLSARYERDMDMALGATLVVAFPAEEAPASDGHAKRYPPESADLDVIRNARDGGVPILALYRGGDVLWEKA